MTDSSADDDWLTEAWRSTRDEVRLYLRTLRDCMFSPRQFGARLRAGERLMNPFAYIAFSLVIMAAPNLFLDQYIKPHLPQPPHMPTFPTWVALFEPLKEYAAAMVSAGVTHVLFRRLGSDRPLHQTVALVFYESGPRALSLWIIVPVQWASVPMYSAHSSAHSVSTLRLVIIVVPALLAVAGILIPMMIAMASLHATKMWKSALASLWVLWLVFLFMAVFFATMRLMPGLLESRFARR